ncbi:MAG: DPP IV N-terminal domain-containing protein [Chloroflexota bacterium]
MTDDLPFLSARTQRFTLGVPRDIGISPDGSRLLFLRSRSGVDPLTCLWALDVASGAERLLVDPGSLGTDGADEPAEELARRERAREQASGIVRWDADDAQATVVFTVGGSLWALDVTSGRTRALPVPPGIADARPSPDGRHVAYAVDGSLRLHDLATGEDRALATPDGPDVTWGLAEFVAAEEMDRDRGCWWAPDGGAVIAQRTDESMVQRWHVVDPTDPGAAPAVLRYPAAGTRNAAVSLRILRLDGTSVEVALADEYLAEVVWDAHGLVVTTMPRDQRALRFRRVDPATGATELVAEDVDAAWVDVQPGLPRHLPDGALVRLGVVDGARRLLVRERAVTPVTLQVTHVLSVDDDRVLVRAHETPSSVATWVYDHRDGSLGRASPAGDGVWSGRLRGGTLVTIGGTLHVTGTQVRYEGPHGSGAIRSLAEDPGPLPLVRIRGLGARSLAAAVLLPRGHVPGSRRLPVLLDPYGGPGHARVLAVAGAWLMPQWFADQGFAVVVADGRGTPGRGPAWEPRCFGTPPGRCSTTRSMRSTPPPRRIRGPRPRSRGHPGMVVRGYLALLAILRRPDVFHAAIAGAPVTDWRLYDTCYTERFLGHPDREPEPYARCSVVGDAAAPRGSLMLIHGLADDNVVPAHALRLSAALLAAGRPPRVRAARGRDPHGRLTLARANLIHLELDFLRRALGVGDDGGGAGRRGPDRT